MVKHLSADTSSSRFHVQRRQDYSCTGICLMFMLLDRQREIYIDGVIDKMIKWCHKDIEMIFVIYLHNRNLRPGYFTLEGVEIPDKSCQLTKQRIMWSNLKIQKEWLFQTGRKIFLQEWRTRYARKCKHQMFNTTNYS